MAGPNLELFKFGLYLFFPLAVMVHYGDPQWYADHVRPIRDQFWPRAETLYRPPKESSELREEIRLMREQRGLPARTRRDGAAQSTESRTAALRGSPLADVVLRERRGFANDAGVLHATRRWPVTGEGKRWV
ncbi:hypothetical protein IE81DRAFT_318459 [Ceraceosorus guamensis]|uniref:Uncharacterized protein n=1 Tax=Ceraceosorus guamensis TaxID=1522189 RepID=A0A316VN89_9BASI|nr:hypothetical protein IE81DRAFT_318459 [Ceraceosorus guamensis]PWN39099.1 hypothetical protein IE81DRAFT_318459 [Ceraceosorus guamensis]